ncbi:hypothetical protein [Streptomyces sediminimaris]|uniref:hypothetical protein n=1 Tax=Streptomyces sediminimaris TaxID=3383721 RepID=UPI0039994DA8
MAALVLCGAVSEAAAVETARPSAGAAARAQATTRAQGRDAPDLAIVIAGGTGRTTVLRSGQVAFARLRQLLRPDYMGTERVPRAWAEGRHPPVDFTVIWGLTGIGGWPQTRRAPGGDVAVERQDQLLAAADGTPWIRTDPAPDVQDDDIRWHRAPRSIFVELGREKLLAGLGTSATAAGGGEDAAEGRKATGNGDDGRGSRWWAVPGLGVGLAVGAVGTLLIRRAAARPGAGPPREDPRQELIDL